MDGTSLERGVEEIIDKKKEDVNDVDLTVWS